MKTYLRAIPIGMLLFSGLANSGLAEAPVVFKSGDWSVHRSKDAMTDKVSCTGIYKTEYGIQLAEDALYISVRGGLEGITLRFDNQAAESLRLPTDMEKRVDAIIIEGNDFTKALGSNRLRAQVLTVLGNVRNYDIDLGGISRAVQNIRSGCPGAAVGSTLPNKPSLCSEKVRARLHSKKVAPEIINYACSSD